MNKADLAKLKRVLGLLGSDHVGERASAALAAHRLLQSKGASWSELLAMPGSARGAKGPTEQGIDYVAAAESRMRQLRRENDRLEAQIKRLKTQLSTVKDELSRIRDEDAAALHDDPIEANGQTHRAHKSFL